MDLVDKLIDRLIGIQSICYHNAGLGFLAKLRPKDTTGPNVLYFGHSLIEEGHP